MRIVWTVFLKELIDSIRDLRSLMTIGVVTVLAGPVILLVIANMLSSFEVKNDRRIVVVFNIADSPSLENYLLRESAQINVAPANYETAIKQGDLQDPVIVVPPHFDADWQSGKPVILTIYTDSSHSKLHAGVGRIKRWLQGYAAMQSEWYQFEQSMPPRMQDFISIEEIDQASDKAQAVKVFGMLPYFLVFAALYGVWGAAIETTVGEREKGTFEALKITVSDPIKLILGKWSAIFLMGTCLAALATLSFLPIQAWIASDNLKAMFNFNWMTALQCVGFIVPLVAVFAALLLFLGAAAKSTRQAQANATLIMLLVAFSPLLISAGSAVSQLIKSFPVLAQHYAILNVLNGESAETVTWVSLYCLHLVITGFFLYLARIQLSK